MHMPGKRAAGKAHMPALFRLPELHIRRDVAQGWQAVARDEGVVARMDHQGGQA